MRCRTADAAVLLNVDDVDIVGANWTLATDDDNVANSNRLLWIGACMRYLFYRVACETWNTRALRRSSNRTVSETISLDHCSEGRSC